jgi:hypothetical protein
LAGKGKILMFPLEMGNEVKHSQINPHFSQRVTFRRNLLQKQSELKRKYPVVNSIADVVSQAKLQQKQVKRDEKLAKYLANNHSFWKVDKKDELLCSSI